MTFNRFHLASSHRAPRFVSVLIVVIAVLAALLPVLAAELPPLVDYPNHLGRQQVLAGLQHSETLRLFYRADWHATPYLAMDGFVRLAANVVPVPVAARLFLATLLLLLALGPLALQWSLHGRVHATALVGLLFVHNATLSLGFMPYLFSLGFGMCLLALWIRFRDDPAWVRLGLLPMLATLLFFCHLVGFAIYGLMAAAYEVGQWLQRRRDGVRTGEWGFRPGSLSGSALALAIQCALPLALFMLFGPASESRGAIGQTTHGGMVRKLELLADAMAYLMPPYIWSLERIVVIVLPLALLGLLLGRWLAFTRQMLLPVATLVALYFAMPMQWLGGWGGDHRLLTALGLLAVACLHPQRPLRWWPMAVAAVVLLVGARTAAVTREWAAADREAQAFVKSFDVIPKGSRIYYAFGHDGGRESWTRPKYFLTCLAAASRESYVPYFFTSENIPGIPLRYQSAYSPLQQLSLGPILTQRASPAWDALLPEFDYFVLVGERHFDKGPPPSLQLVHQGAQHRIYRNTRRAAVGSSTGSVSGALR